MCTSDDNDVKIYDAKTLEYVKSLPSGPDPELLTLHPDGKRLYIANEDDNLVTVVDINTGQVITEIPVGVEPEGMGMSPDGKVLVNTSETTNMAHFIDTTQHKTFDNVLVDSRPRVAIFNSAQTQLWVSSEVGGTVTVINPADRKIIAQDPLRNPGHHEGSYSARRYPDYEGRQDRVRRTWSCQPRGCYRYDNVQGAEVHPRRAACLADVLHTG